MTSAKAIQKLTPMAIFMGPQRAGTSWLHRYFSKRSDVCLPAEVKELFYFDFNFNKKEDVYLSYFKREPQHEICMEVSATYFFHPDAPKRIYEYFGDNVKLVCPLRHPVTRSYSLYQHFLRYGIVKGTLQEACAEKPEILITSRYVQHIKNWTKYYDLKQLYFCFQEDLAEDPENYLKDLCNHLQIPYKPIAEDAQGYLNVSTKPPVQFIANIAHIAASKLRSLRLYWVINFAKAVGLKKLIFGTDTHKTLSENISEEDLIFLEEKLAGQIELLETLLGKKIHIWDHSL